jgi:hypothetical protein
MMKSIWRILGVLMLPVALSAQPVSHALVASPVDLPLTRRAFIAGADTVNVLAVMVQFQEDNDQRTTGKGRFDTSHVTATDVPVDAPPRDRSYFEQHLTFLSNYFARASKGKLVVRTRMVPTVITLQGTMMRYSPPKNAANTPVADLARDAWRAADSLGLFTDFQSSDAFVVFHAGVGRDIDLVGSLGYDPAPLDIPSLYLGANAFKDAHDVAGIPVHGGAFLIPNSIVIPETESRSIPGIGGDVFLEYSINGLLCASLGNYLGLPDLFDTKTGRTAIGRFGLMDGQSIFSFGGVFPPEPSAWEKYWLGWIEPVTVAPGQRTLSLPAVALADTVFRIPIGAREYYLVENRNRDPQQNGQRVTMAYNGATTVKSFPRDTTGFDAFDITALQGTITDVEDLDWSLPGGVDTKGMFYDGGILVWHIDETVIAAGLATNTVNTNPERRGIDLEEADGSQDLGQEYGFLSAGSGSETGTALDFWYSGNASPINTNSFSSTTRPASLSNDGGLSHVTLKDFSTRGPHMTATVIVGDGKVAPLAGFPKETRMMLAPEALTIASVRPSDRSVVFVGTTRTTAPVVREGSAPPAQASANLFAWGLNGHPPLSGGNMDGYVTPGSSNAGSGYATGPSISDLNGDGVTDLVIGENGAVPQVRGFTLRDLNGDGLADTLFSRVVTTAITTQPIIGPGGVIAVGGTQGRVHWFTGGGVLVRSDRVLADSTASVSGIAVYPTGNAFVITGGDGSIVVTARTPAGLATDIAARRLPHHIIGPPGVAGSGSSVMIALGTSEGLVYLLDGTLATMPGFPVNAGMSLSLPPVFADINGDGSRDVIAFAGNRILVWNASGSTLDNYPVTIPVTDTLTSAPVIADVNGDKRVDLLGGTDRGLIVAYDRTGRPVDGFPLVAGAGKQSIGVTISTDSILVFAASGNDGSISGWLTGKTTDPTNAALSPWPQAGRDAQHSGYDPTLIAGVPLASDFFPPSRAYNWPNPAYDGKTMIRYYIRDQASVTIRIFDMAGDLVATLRGPGVAGMDNEVIWDLGGVESGVYFAHIDAAGNAGSGSAVVKIAVVK